MKFIFLITNFTSQDPLKFRRKPVGNVTENFTSRLRSTRYKITPRLINSTTRLLKNFKISKDSKVDNEQNQAANCDVSIIFQDQVTNKKQTILKKKEQIVKRAAGILLRERNPIKFFYRGSVKTQGFLYSFPNYSGETTHGNSVKFT